MKYLKFIGLNIIVFCSLFFFLSLLFPGTISNVKSINIVADQAKVYHNLQSVNTWKTWSAFSTTDTGNIKILLSNKDTIATIWEHNNGTTFLSYHTLTNIDKNSTAINWVIQEKIKWYHPVKKFAALFRGNSISQAMEVSLVNFKKLIESQSIINQEN